MPQEKAEIQLLYNKKKKIKKNEEIDQQQEGKNINQ